MNNLFRKLLIFIGILITLSLALSAFNVGGAKTTEVSLGEVVKRVQDGKVKSIDVVGDRHRPHARVRRRS
jgi:hypothetical protein